jgi:hypothetical protein
LGEKLRDLLIAAWKLVSHVEKQVDALQLLTRCGDMPMNHCKTKANLHRSIEQWCD